MTQHPTFHWAVNLNCAM